MRVCLIEPFFAGSHAAWARGYQAHSGHEVEILSLPGRFWKWRMHGGAVSLARQFSKLDTPPDLILATDMLDLATFRGLLPEFAGIPTALYFHENQLTYPWSPSDEDVALKRDNHYAWLNFTSALAADRLFFNSDYHRESFLGSLPEFLRQFPDHNETDLVGKLAGKSETLWLGMELERLEGPAESDGGPPVILWNHRWEYDKGPEEFFEMLFELQEAGEAFRLIVLGESYARQPEIFDQARERLADRILHFGYAEDFASYAQLLRRADLLPVTSRQDFFGGSIVEAIYAGCIPLLPERLSYPEHLPAALRSSLMYSDAESLRHKLKALLNSRPAFPELKARVARYDWKTMAPKYDIALEKVRK